MNTPYGTGPAEQDGPAADPALTTSQGCLLQGGGEGVFSEGYL